MRFETATSRKVPGHHVAEPSARPVAEPPPRVERPATGQGEPPAVTRPHLAKWLAENRGAVEADIRVRDPDRVPPNIRDALKALRPLALALLVTDVINRDGDSWRCYRREVDALVAVHGLTRADALRRAYLRRFGVDPGPIDPAGLAWLWEGA